MVRPLGWNVFCVFSDPVGGVMPRQFAGLDGVLYGAVDGRFVTWGVASYCDDEIRPSPRWPARGDATDV
jgi:hypothetical protein